MKPCFGYIRVSTLRQGEGVSLEAQKDAIAECAIKRGLTITEWFEEKETAAKIGRPIFNHMIARLRRQHAIGLVVHKLDRSARNLQDWATVSQLMDEDIEFHIATEPIDFSTRGGRMTADFLAVIAADFSRNQREETRKGLQGRLKQGLYPFKSPLGYLDNGKGKAKTPCPIASPLIKEAFRLYLSGQHSLKSLREEMYRRGLRNHSGGKVSLHGIEKVLSNTFYYGKITILRTGDTYDGIHEPLLSKAEYKRIQMIKSRRCGPKVTKHNFLFRGLFRCADCAGPLIPERQKAHVYYRCQCRECPMKTFREDRLETALRARLADIQLSKAAIKEMRTEWKHGKLTSNLRQQRRSLTASIEATETKLARAADLLIEGGLDQQTYDAKKAEANFDLVQLRSNLEDLPDPADIKRDRDLYVSTMSNVANLYANLTKPEKRQLLENVFSKRIANTARVFLEVRQWTDPQFMKGGVLTTQKGRN